MSSTSAYFAGRPVMARRGENRQLVTGFVVFSDGVGFTDDQYLDPLPTRPPEHHLFGAVERVGETLTCQGWTFSELLDGDQGVAQWNVIFADPGRPVEAVQDEAEYLLKETRSPVQ